MRFRFLLPALLLLAAPAFAQEPVDSAAVAFIKAEALEQGQVMDHALWLTEIHGPRLTGSPQLDAAQAWAADQFRTWGLTAELDPWGTFGRGWAVERFALNASAAGPDIASQTFPVVAYPKAWSPSTGRVTAEVIVVDLEEDGALDALRGQLGDKIVLLAPEPAEVELGFDALASRRESQSLLEQANASLATRSGGRTYSPEVIARFRARQQALATLLGERPLAVLEPSGLGGTGAIRVMGATVPLPEGATFTDRPNAWDPGAAVTPQFVVQTEHYNRIVRLLNAGQEVVLDLDFEAMWTDNAVVEENVIAEIPGTDPALRNEVVMLGAHLDSWHAGTGATDNASGSSVVMEAARVLQAYFDERGEGPRRTIRFALWTGEEQGLYGSLGYVNDRYASIASYGAPATALGPEHDQLSAYYNLDNGTGRIRGVYTQSNPAVGPIFRAWLDAFADSTAQTLTLNNTGGTDHLPFDQAGLPGFQFIQDPIAYGSQTWHTSMDTFDHLVEDDLAQAAALMATFAFHTAKRDERLPRKPVELAEEAAMPAGTGLDPEIAHELEHLLHPGHGH